MGSFLEGGALRVEEMAIARARAIAIAIDSLSTDDTERHGLMHLTIRWICFIRG